MGKKTIIFIGGPTASGKTALAITLANKLKCEIISADSRQFYKGMAIGTAQPTKEELSQAIHHFIAFKKPNENVSAGDFEEIALKKADQLFQDNDFVICVGGSGLFMKALYQGFDEFPEINPQIREALNQDLKTKGLEFLQEELKQKDPTHYQKVDLKNHQRVIRALEICRGTGKPYSSFLGQKKDNRSFESVLVQTNLDRETLYDRINLRVDLMYQSGLLREVELLKDYWEENSLNTVGYKENIAYLKGEISFDQATELLKKNTRNFAKRQITWFKKEGFVPVKEVNEVIDQIRSQTS